MTSSCSALLRSTGPLGGGTILVGGDFHGAGTVRRAQRTYVDSNTLIDADAADDGKGGNVAVWSDTDTEFYGTITVRSGPNGGNGGMVETSSHNYLAPDGIVYANSPHGLGGTWLLDPSDINIDSYATGTGLTSSGSNPITWANNSSDTSTTGSGGTSELLNTTINSELNAGTNVIIQTTNTGSGDDGDIFVKAHQCHHRHRWRHRFSYLVSLSEHRRQRCDHRRRYRRYRWRRHVAGR